VEDIQLPLLQKARSFQLEGNLPELRGMKLNLV
jgi:hypothetical protein